MPPIKPDVTRVRLFGGNCACCGGRVTAPAPSGLEPGSPFGQSIAAMVVYLHYAHAIGLERLRERVCDPQTSVVRLLGRGPVLVTSGV